MEPVMQERFSDRERLAVVENNIHNLKESQSGIEEDVALIQKEVSELSGLIKVNNALLTAVSEDMKKVKERTDFMPKAVLSTVVALGIGFLFTQATTLAVEDSTKSTASQLMQARLEKEEPTQPSKESEPEDESKD